MGGRNQPAVVGVIVARLESKRFPKKVLAEINSIPMIQVQMNRMDACKMLTRTGVACPFNDALSFGGIGSFTYGGNEYDVLQRIFDLCAKEDMKQDDILVKFTMDSPLIDPEMVDKIVGEFVKQQADFGFLKWFPKGMYFNMMRVGALRLLAAKISKEDRAIWNQINETWIWSKYAFKTQCFQCEHDFSDVNLEVNTPEDLERVRSIFRGEGDL